MKPIIPFALLSAFLAVGAQGAVTDPVGYTTVNVEPGIFNLAGVTLHEPIAAAGVVTSADATSITDADADFSTLDEGEVYLLEITSGAGAGTIQEVVAPASGTSLTTPEDISGLVTAGSTTYTVRKASTLDSIFGADNSVANLEESPDGSDTLADLVLLPKSDGSFDTYFFVNAPGVFVGWFDGAAAAGDTVINYADGLYIRTRPGSGANDFVITGAVKTGETDSMMIPGFNLVNSVAPAGSTLASSGLSAFMAPSTDGSTTGADLLQIPDEASPGAFKTYFYVNAPGVFEGWFDGAAPADDVPLEGGFFIRNFGAARSYTVNGPVIAPAP